MAVLQRYGACRAALPARTLACLSPHAGRPARRRPVPIAGNKIINWVSSILEGVGGAGGGGGGTRRSRFDSAKERVSLCSQNVHYNQYVSIIIEKFVALFFAPFLMITEDDITPR